MPERDAGVYLYVAERLLAGDAPYVDVWDHKPPLVYGLHALALVAAPDPVLASRSIEAVALLSAAILCFLLLERWLDRRTALFGSLVVVLAAARLLEGGNGIELFALPLQLAALWVFVAARGEPSRSGWVAIGLLLGSSILLKPTLIASWVAMAVVVLARQRSAWPAALRTLLPTVVAAAAVIAAALALLAAVGAGPAAIDAVILYNAGYAAVDWSDRVGSMVHGTALLTPTGLAPLGIIGWIVGALGLARGTVRDATRPLLAVAIVALPLDVVLSSLAGRNYAHYFLAWLPTFGLLAGFAFRCTADALPRAVRGHGPRRALPLAIAAVWLITFDARLGLATVAFQASDEVQTRVAAVAYVREHASPNASVLMWGAESIVNAVAERRAPGRFAYTYPLYTIGYTTPALVEEFIEGLEADSPILIIDASRAADGHVAPLDTAAASQWRSAGDGFAELPEIAAIRAWVATRYDVEALIGPQRWTVYRRTAPRSRRGPCAKDLTVCHGSHVFDANGRWTPWRRADVAPHRRAGTDLLFRA